MIVRLPGGHHVFTVQNKCFHIFFFFSYFEHKFSHSFYMCPTLSPLTYQFSFFFKLVLVSFTVTQMHCKFICYTLNIFVFTCRMHAHVLAFHMICFWSIFVFLFFFRNYFKMLLYLLPVYIRAI